MTVEKYRLVVDLEAGTIRPQSYEIVQLVPGELHYRDYDGGYSRVVDRPVISSDRFVLTGLHDDLAEAKAAAAAELRRRGERLVCLAERCEELEGGIDG